MKEKRRSKQNHPWVVKCIIPTSMQNQHQFPASMATTPAKVQSTCIFMTEQLDEWLGVTNYHCQVVLRAKAILTYLTDVIFFFFSFFLIQGSKVMNLPELSTSLLLGSLTTGQIIKLLVTETAETPNWDSGDPKLRHHRPQTETAETHSETQVHAVF